MWKNWPCWLKGGIIGIALSIILFFWGLLGGICWDWGGQTPLYCHMLFPINGTLGGTPGVISILLYVFYGVTTGWIVDKIKQNKS
ncbi:MAG: hypothetical protein WCG60_01765 [bacterium]